MACITATAPVQGLTQRLQETTVSTNSTNSSSSSSCTHWAPAIGSPSTRIDQSPNPSLACEVSSPYFTEEAMWLVVGVWEGLTPKPSSIKAAACRSHPWSFPTIPDAPQPKGEDLHLTLLGETEAQRRSSRKASQRSGPGGRWARPAAHSAPPTGSFSLWPEGQAFYNPHWEALRYLMLTPGASRAAHSTQ